MPVYESIQYDYRKLADLMHRLSDLYAKTATRIRMESHYFLVAFYGKDLPSYLSNKKFVFRGEKLELWSAFKQRMVANYFGCQFVDSVEHCTELLDAVGKYVQVTRMELTGCYKVHFQIIPITPQPSSTYSELNKSPSRLVRWYYKYHKISRFEQSRRENRKDTKWTRIDANDATRLWLRRKYITIQHSLPDILHFAPVVEELEPEPSNPVEVAIQQIQEVNENLTETANLVSNGFVEFLVNLGGQIRGVIQVSMLAVPTRLLVVYGLG